MDQGSELSEHAVNTAVLDHGVFFAHPSSPWQRGSNENANGLLRQYLPMSTDLGIHTAADPRGVEDRIDKPATEAPWLENADPDLWQPHPGNRPHCCDHRLNSLYLQTGLVNDTTRPSSVGGVVCSSW